MNGASGADTAHESYRSVFTTVRQITTPYLPPPILQVLHATDTYFRVNHEWIVSNYCHDEPSIVILSSFILAYLLVYKFAWGVWSVTTKRSTAHLSGVEDTILGELVASGTDHRRHRGGVDVETEKRWSSHGVVPAFQETVVLCGASNSGKTTLFHYLCHSSKGNSWNPPMTVTSLVANVRYLCPWEDASDNNAVHHDSATIRVIDYPGHPTLLSQLSTLLYPTTLSRLIFTLDATQAVTEGAALLYRHILTHDQLRQSWLKTEKKKLVILVVCTKSDMSGSKNYKRMKIQLRNELEKLRKVDLAINDSSSTNSADNNYTVDSRSKIILPTEGKSIDLDNLGADIPVSLHFVETGFGLSGFDAVREFVCSGALPSVK